MKRRAAILLALAVLWTAAIVARLWDLQVRRHDEYRRRAERQQQRVVELDPPRGTIRDARGRELAVSIEVDSAYAVPQQVQDPSRVVQAVARIAGGDPAKLLRQLEADKEFVWLARKLDPPQAEALRALNLPGVYFWRESKRYYPLRALAAGIVGYVGTDDHGLAGLEAEYDQEIAGKPGRRIVLRDARRGTAARPDDVLAEAEAGASLELTLDAAIQQVTERELGKAVAQYQAKSGTAVVLDPRSGAVLAMASLPSFDPNRFGEAPAQDRRNRAIQDAFEPGSTFKMVTAAAALGANLLDPNDVLDCQMGSITLAGVTIHDHKPFGLLTFRDVIAKSSDIGAIKIGLQLGDRRLYDAIRGFGFGQQSGIDLPGESAGLLRPVERWAYVTKAYVAFGQGLATTALQIANAFAAVANGGHLLRPYVVQAVERGGVRRDLHPAPVEISRPADPATMRPLERMLEGVVTDGTAKAAAVPGYTVAGKTGTAQKAIGGTYSPDRFVGSFVGFAPARRPELVAIVVINEPRGGRYQGGEVAAPTFSAILRESLLYLGVPPDRDPPEHWPGEAAPQDSSPPNGVVLASATVPDPVAVAPAAGPAVPDLSGLTAREAIARSTALGLHPVVNGSGFVTRQEPAPGAPLSAPGERIELWLQSGAR